MAVALGTLLNGLRLRHRLSALRRLGDQPVAPGTVDTDDHQFVVVPATGVVVDDVTRREAIAHARAEGIEVLDLVPGDLPRDQALDLARLVDTTTYRGAVFAAGRGGAPRPGGPP